ncbi:hypothetical protein OIU78_020327 [Salix suchowensis]|nr:hypothetical protein OIU78_020327 [Salix suchowensis]
MKHIISCMDYLFIFFLFNFDPASKSEDTVSLPD